jgi:hypothetical protein
MFGVRVKDGYVITPSTLLRFTRCRKQALVERFTDAFELTSQRLRYRLRATLPAVYDGFGHHERPKQSDHCYINHIQFENLSFFSGQTTGLGVVKV